MADELADVLTPKEVTAALKLSEKTVLQYLRDGRLPGFRVGKHWRVRRADLAAVIASSPPPPPPAPVSAAGLAEEAAGDPCAQIRAVLVALLRMLLPEGERRALRDLGITALPLAPLNALLASEGYVIEAYEVEDPARFVDCVGQDGVPEPFGLFEMRRLNREE